MHTLHALSGLRTATLLLPASCTGTLLPAS